MVVLILKLCKPRGRMLLFMLGILVAMIAFFQFWTFPSRSYFSAAPSHEELAVSLITIEDASHSGYSVVNNRSLDNYNNDKSPRLNLGEGGFGEIQMHTAFPLASREFALSKVVESSENKTRERSNTESGNSLIPTRKFRNLENGVEQLYISKKDDTLQDSGRKTDFSLTVVDTHHHNVEVSTNFSSVFSQTSLDPIGALGSTSSSPINGIKQVVDLESGSMNKDSEASLRNESSMIERYVRKMRGSTITIYEMESVLIKGSPSTWTPMKGKRSAAHNRERELISARLQIKNAPILRNFADLHPSLFRNVSVFKRSYELMERIFKIYTYKEGEKPIFHQPKLRGIYAAEGWFMKLLERNKRFNTRDPKRAHLFYLPFSSETLRWTIYGEGSHSMKNLEHYLMGYVNLIKKKYQFWNRTEGADHFFVACHDWAPRITREHMSSCIRVLCNANAARGFTIGKDVSVPVTFVQSANDPLKDIGGKPSSERRILAFFAGGIHGYLRPLLLKYWENKTSDMKIFGPMKRDVEGKVAYREFMKSSKYCICARGFEVHTPRVVESIYYECVPVIISDNYVPPFFEVLDWEAFAVFIQEKDIPNLRNILLSIPEDRYDAMQLRVKMVQRHFVWHKVPEKYDLFHMILHSIWYNRISQISPQN